MKTTTPTAARPATAADITPAWVVLVALPLREEGQAYRAGAHACTIEIQSINTGQWMPLNLPTNGSLFVDEKTRDAALGCIDLEVRHATIARDRASKSGQVCPICRGAGYTSNLGGISRDCDCVRENARP